MAHLIMGDTFHVAGVHRQHRLAALKRLALALFVYGQDNRLLRRIEIQPHDGAHFLHEKRIGGDFERPLSARLQRKGPSHAMDAPL